MSQAPIQVVFAPVTTAVDQYLANLRANPPVVGVNFAPGVPPSAATFSTGSLGTFGAGGGVSPSIAAAVGFGQVPGSGAAIGAAQSVQSAQVLTQAASSLQSAASSLQSVVGSLSSIVGRRGDAIGDLGAPGFAQSGFSRPQPYDIFGVGGTYDLAPHVPSTSSAWRDDDLGAVLGGPGGGGGSLGGRRSRNPLENFSRFRRIFAGGAILFESLRDIDAGLKYSEDESLAERRGGALGADPLESLRAHQRFNESIRSSVPALGQLFGRGLDYGAKLFERLPQWAGGGRGLDLGGYDSRTDAERIQDIEVGREARSIVYDTRLGQISSESRVRSARREIDVLGLPPGYSRQLSQADNTVSEKRDQFRLEEQKQEFQVRTSRDKGEAVFNAESFKLDELRREHVAELAAAQTIADANKAEISRKLGVDFGLTAQSSIGLVFRAQGQIGRGSEADFILSLARDQAAATEKGPIFGAFQRFVLNPLQQAAHENEIAFQISQRDRETGAIGYELGGDSFRAARLRLDSERDAALRTAAPSERDSINRNFTSRGDLADLERRHEIEHRERLNTAAEFEIGRDFLAASVAKINAARIQSLERIGPAGIRIGGFGIGPQSSDENARDRSAINNGADLQIDRTTQQFRDAGNRLIFGQRAELESLRFASQTGIGGPRIGGILAQSNDIFRGAEQSALDDANNERFTPEQQLKSARNSLRIGIGREERVGENIVRNFQPEELDSINQQATSGPGTADVSEVMKKQAEDIAEMKEALKMDLPAIRLFLETKLGAI